MAEPNVVLNNSGLKSPAQGSTTREQDLISRVQRGQNELFYELVRPYERRVYAAATATPRSPAPSSGFVQLPKAWRGSSGPGTSMSDIW